MGVIKIPNSASIQQARGFLRNTDWSLDDEVTVRFHDRWCHMQPWIIAALAAWGVHARERGLKISLENAHRATYAWRFGLAEYLGVDPGIEVQEKEEAGRFVALRTIRTRDDLGQLMGDVVPMLHLAEEPEQARAVHYVLSEMIRNVLEHSGTDDGAVICAQYYSGEGAGGKSYVSVGVADIGRGIRQALQTNYPEISDDAESLLKAIQPGVTGVVPGVYGTPDNAGAGLFYTRRLSEVTDNYFAIGSGDAMFRTSTAVRKPADAKLVFPINSYPGTMVSVNFSLHPEVAFDAFLQVTGQAFGELDKQLRARVEEGVQFE